MPASTVIVRALGVVAQHAAVPGEVDQDAIGARDRREAVPRPDALHPRARGGRACTMATSSASVVGRRMAVGAHDWLPAQLVHEVRSFMLTPAT